MNLPNKLTLMRILIIPIMVVVFFIPYLKNNTIFLGVSYSNFINLILFAIASFTDMLDGKIARKYNLVTTFGKFADPLADKMLVFTAMLMFVSDRDLPTYVVPVWCVIIIIIREFFVSGVRMLSSDKGRPAIAASIWGKMKTAFTMVALCVIFLYQIDFIVELIGAILFYISTFVTVLSGIDYFIKNKEIFKESI